MPCVSPTSTSEPAPLPEPVPADPAGPESAVATTTTALPGNFQLARGFFGDALLACLALIAASTLLITPLIVVQAIRETGGSPGKADLEAVMQSLVAEITAASVLAMLLAGALVWWFRGRRLPSPRAPMAAARAYPLAFCAGLAIQGTCLLVSMLAQALGTTIVPSNADPVQDMVRETPWLAWITVVAFAPLAEELLFRHVLLRRFAVAGRGVLGIAVTSLLFAALHEVTPGVPTWPAWLAAVVLYTTMGAGFGATYLWTGRYGAAVVAHAACNLAAMGLVAFSLA